MTLTTSYSKCFERWWINVPGIIKIYYEIVLFRTKYQNGKLNFFIETSAIKITNCKSFSLIQKCLKMYLTCQKNIQKWQLYSKYFTNLNTCKSKAVYVLNYRNTYPWKITNSILSVSDKIFYKENLEPSRNHITTRRKDKNRSLWNENCTTLVGS